VEVFASDLGFGLRDLAIGKDGELYYLTGGKLGMIRGPFESAAEPSFVTLLTGGSLLLSHGRLRRARR
jgi:hypothetical protein